MSPTLQPLHTPLVQCAAETERHVSASGWEQPVRLFALVATAKLITAEPHLADQLKDAEDGALSAIEQEGLPSSDSLEELLGMLAWPEDVDGVAIALERIVLPPEAESDLPEDPRAAAKVLATHPDRVDVRLLVAVTRDGESTCLLRQRPHDSDDQVAIGHDIAPDLVAALAATLED